MLVLGPASRKMVGGTNRLLVDQSLQKALAPVLLGKAHVATSRYAIVVYSGLEN